MATFLSPGVFTNEIDLSALPGSTAGIIPAFVGTAKKGLLNTPVLVTNAQQFLDAFGAPFPESFLGYAVMAYLEEGNLCWVVRVGIEEAAGQPDALADVAIDVSGAHGHGWGRLPLFQGIDFGKLLTRAAGTGWDFHPASTTFDNFNDAALSTTDGPTSATMTFTGTYSGSIADSFLVLVTSPAVSTSGSNVDGAGFLVIRSSDGAQVASGNLVESGTPGVSDPVTLPDGVVFTVHVTAGHLDVNDLFNFSVLPENRLFTVNVDNVAGNPFTMPTGTIADAATFAATVNTLIGSGEPYFVVDNGDGTATFRTRIAGNMIQLVTTEGFALEIGVSLYAFNIPRSHLIGTQTGLYNITTSNNSVAFQVAGTVVKGFTANIPVALNQPASSLASAINAAATVLGDTLVRAYSLVIPGGDSTLVVETTVAHELDQVSMLADGSHIKTLRFAETVGVLYPYTLAYTGFTSTQATLPAGGEITPDSPRSCEIDPFSTQCAVDSAYYSNIVGFLVAVSPGTWIDGYTVTLQPYQTTPGHFSMLIYDTNLVLQSRVDDITFDPTAVRYIGNVINPGSPLGGTNGNEFVNWERRPLFLNDDPTVPSTFEVRTPALFSGFSFLGSANGIPTDPIYSTELDSAVIGNPALGTGLYSFDNPENYDISLLSAPGFTSGAVIVTGLSICTSRTDCLYLVDPPFGLNAQQVVDWHNGLLFTDLAVALNSNYGALYHPWIKIFDQYNGGTIFIPPSGHVSAVFARTDRVAEIWFAPAGLNRGQLITALDTDSDLTRGERDLLYGLGNAVNPIVNFPQKGIFIYGQRTLQRKASALDRVNVRMLLIAIKKGLSGPNGLLQYFLFEPNDRITRQLVTSKIDSFMSDIAARRGVTAWQTICDDRNNTPQRIDRNELWISLLLKPTRAIEFIVLNLGILSTDQSFASSEVLAAVGVTATA